MIRLRRDDFEDPTALSKLAAAVGLSLEDFRRQFTYLTESESRSTSSAGERQVVVERGS